MSECEDCRGKGHVELLFSSKPCKACGGTGKISALRAASNRIEDYIKPIGSAEPTQWPGVFRVRLSEEDYAKLFAECD